MKKVSVQKCAKGLVVMKKYTSWAAVILCVCLSALPVSAAQAEPYQLYQSAAEMMGEITSMQIDGSIIMIMTVGEADAVTFDMGFTALQRVNSKDQIEMSIIMDKNDLGIEMESYYRSGYYFMNTGGEKTRIKMPDSEALGQAGISFGSAEEYFEDAIVEELSKGVRVKYKISGEYVSEVMGDSMSAVISQNDAEVGAEIGDITCYTTIDEDGLIKSERMAYTMRLTGSQDIKIRYNVSMKYSHINEVEKIPFPSDLKDYKKVTTSSQTGDARSSAEVLNFSGSVVAV